MTCAEAVAREAGAGFRTIGFSDLHDRAQLFAEELGKPILVAGRQIDVHPHAASKCHFEQRDEKSAIRAIVVGEEFSGAGQFLNRREEALQPRRVVEIRRHVADLSKDLRQGRPTQAILAHAQIDQEQLGFAHVGSKLRRERAANVGGRRECADDERERRGHALFLAVFPPHRAHGHGVLAHRNGDAEGRGQLFANGADGVVEAGVLAGMTGGRHPVGRQLDLADVADGRAGDVGDGLADRQADRGRGVEQRDRRAFAHGHGLAGEGVVAGGGHRGVGHRHLPRPDHLVARDESRDRAVADGDEEGLVRHRGQAQHARDGLAQIDTRGGERLLRDSCALDVANHLGRLAQEHRQRHVDGLVAEVRIRDR